MPGFQNYYYYFIIRMFIRKTAFSTLIIHIIMCVSWWMLQVVYFNTYLADPRRPQLPEHPATRVLLSTLPGREGQLTVPSGFHGPPPAMMGYRPPPMVYPGLFISCTGLSLVFKPFCCIVVVVVVVVVVACASRSAWRHVSPASSSTDDSELPHGPLAIPCHGRHGIAA